MGAAVDIEKLAAGGGGGGGGGGATAAREEEDSFLEASSFPLVMATQF